VAAGPTPALQLPFPGPGHAWPGAGEAKVDAGLGDDLDEAGPAAGLVLGHPALQVLGPAGVVTSVLIALVEMEVGLTGLALLDAGSLAFQALAPALFPRAEVGPDLDAGRAEVAVDDDPLARLESPQLLHRDQGPVTGRLAGGDPATGIGRVVGLGDRLVADQLGAQLQGADIGQAGEEDLGPVAVEDGGGPVAVAVDQLGLVVPDRQQLDALASSGGRPFREELEGGDVAGFVEGAEEAGSSIPSGALAACSWAVWASCMATVSNNGRSRRCSCTGAYR
jgi:hypothetical protein